MAAGLTSQAGRLSHRQQHFQSFISHLALGVGPSLSRVTNRRSRHDLLKETL